MLFAKSNTVWIVLATLFNVIEQNYAAFLRCYCGDISKYVEVPLANPDSLITADNPCIDVTKHTMMLLHGFGNDPNNEPAIKTVISVYISLKKLNVILVNWGKESQGIPGSGALGYPVAVKNSKTVAVELAKAILRLIQLGLCAAIHLIGHSLGAHLAGYTGLQTMKNNFTIPWITGLDPARPGFENSSSLYPPLSKQCAKYVDVIHSDPGGYGRREPSGHIDIFANYRCYTEGGPEMQPGCEKGFSLAEIGSGGNKCSHDRAWVYYSKAVTNPEIFKIGCASDYDDWVEKNGHFADEEITVLGPKVDKTKRGIFYFTTSTTDPWGLGEDGLLDRACPSDGDQSILSAKGVSLG